MPMPKSVKLGGVELKEVYGVSLSLETPQNERGYHKGSTYCATLELLRRAKNSPTSEMFKWATNEDGKLAYIDGTVVLQSSKHAETYTIDMKKAYIQSWEFHQPDDESEMFETIVVKIGELTLSGSGKSETFKVQHWDREA